MKARLARIIHDAWASTCVVVSTGHPRREIDQFAKLPRRPENRFNGETRRLSS